MASPVRPWTRAELDRLPDDGNRYEVLDGVLLVTPLPAVQHQRVALRLGALLLAHCDRHGAGVVVGPGAIPRGDSELQPDVLVIPGRDVSQEARWEDLPTPILVVEVASPSTRIRDRSAKRAAYLRWGIQEYWIVDVEQGTVTVIRPGADDAKVTDVLHWQPRADLPALEIPLQDLFR